MGELALIQDAESLGQVIESQREKFTKIAESRKMPAHINMDSEKAFAMQHLMANGFLMKVAKENPISLAQAMTNIASIGLSLNPALKQAYLVPRNVAGVAKVCFDPSYQGLCDLATGTGKIQWIQANLYYSGDTIEFQGIDKEPKHTYNPFLKKEGRGEFMGVYSVAKTDKGDYLTEYMSAEDVYKIRDSSEMWKSKKSGPWKDFFEEMAKKSVVRRQFKMLPKAIVQMQAISEAILISNENEGLPPIINSPEIHQYTPAEKAHYDSLISSNNALEMYIMSRTTPEGAWIALYHSFPHGEKGKYRKIVDSLVDQGCATARECAEALQEAVQRMDDLGVREILDGLSDASQAFLLALAGPEVEQYWKSLESGKE